DLVEHVGQGQLPLGLKRALGVGNSTGLGMAPFLVSHPDLLHAWMNTRESVLASAMSRDISPDDHAKIVRLAHQAMQHLLEWNVPDPEHQDRIVVLRRDWARWVRTLNAGTGVSTSDLHALVTDANTADFEELAIAWIVEALGETPHDIATQMCAQHPADFDGTQSCDALLAAIHGMCDFALDPDYASQQDTAQFWYVSQSKLEPRLGQRHSEPGADLESPLDVARRVAHLAKDLAGATGPLWQFLADHPEHRDAACRVQRLHMRPYSEIRNNLICASTQPIDMLRCKLSFFGATKFDPKSKLWTRIALGQGAPLADDIASGAMSDQAWLSTFAP
ncbi:MAG: hypothetical protein AAF386_13940, partial [Pseudomonadota bacterium]